MSLPLDSAAGTDRPGRTRPGPPRTVAAQLTPEGRGAIAVVAVHGPDAIPAADAVFRSARGRSLRAAAVGRLLYGRIEHAGAADEVVVSVVAAGPVPEVEICCHGGVAAVRTVLDALAAVGAPACHWVELVRRREAGTVRAEAFEALAAAPTARTADLLLDQYHGVFDRELEQIGALGAAGERAAAHARVRNLLARAPLGLHLKRPWSVALAGRPNVGKSSLLNRIVGYERGIVDPLPGTTRDVVTALAALDGWPIELADTAGIRGPAADRSDSLESLDALEEAGIRRAEETFERSDCGLIVFDTSRPLTAADRGLLARWPTALRVGNKCDLPTAWPAGEVPGLVLVSARTAAGLPLLLDSIARRLVPDPPPPGAALPFTERQVELLENMERALRQAERSDPR